MSNTIYTNPLGESFYEWEKAFFGRYDRRTHIVNIITFTVTLFNGEPILTRDSYSTYTCKTPAGCYVALSKYLENEK